MRPSQDRRSRLHFLLIVLFAFSSLVSAAQYDASNDSPLTEDTALRLDQAIAMVEEEWDHIRYDADHPQWETLIKFKQARLVKQEGDMTEEMAEALLAEAESLLGQIVERGLARFMSKHPELAALFENLPEDREEAQKEVNARMKKRYGGRRDTRSMANLGLFAEMEMPNSIKCTYIVGPNGDVFGIPATSGQRIRLSSFTSGPVGTVGAFRYDREPLRYYYESKWENYSNGFELLDKDVCATEEESLEVYAVFKDEKCGLERIIKGTFEQGSDVSQGLNLSEVTEVDSKKIAEDLPNLSDQSQGSPMIGVTDLLKQGRLVGDYNGDGVMFAIEIGGEDRYVFRRYGTNGLSQQYYLWYEGCGWAEYELLPGEMQRLSPEFMTLMEIWEVAWTAIRNDPVHSTLGALGFVPVFGVVFDGLDAIVYVIEGDALGATLASAAIISSAVVVGAKIAMKVAKNARKAQQVVELTDDYARQMETILKSVENGSGAGREALIKYQASLMEIAAKYGDDELKTLVELSQGMDELEFLKVAQELKSVDNGADLFADLAKAEFKAFIQEFGEAGMRAWKIVKNAPQAFRTNIANLRKLMDFSVATSVDDISLINSFKNARDPQKWVDLKIPQSGLEDIYDGFKNDPPFELTPWTPQHKAERWAQHKMRKGDNAQEFTTWSNTYDGNISKASNATKGVDDYHSALNWGKREVTIEVQGLKRRLDVADIDDLRGIEFKEYASGKVYATEMVKKEAELDEILVNAQGWEMEWIFKNCEPSGPLRKILEDASITIKLI